jgi:hypothetical protein
MAEITKDWCLNMAAKEGDAEIGAGRLARDPAMEKAMGPRQNPLHPMFRHHNCGWCLDGKRPCKQGNPSQCEFPHARND